MQITAIPSFGQGWERGATSLASPLLWVLPKRTRLNGYPPRRAMQLSCAFVHCALDAAICARAAVIADSSIPSFSSRSGLTAPKIAGFIRLPSRTALPMSCRVGCAGIACKLPQQQRQDSETGQQRNEVASDLRGVGPWRLGRTDKFGGGRGPRAGDASGKGKRRGGGAYEIRHSGRCIESRRDGEPPSALPATKK